MYRYKLQMILLLLIMLIVSMGTTAFADYATNLVFSGYLQDSSGDIDVGAYSVPVVYDWDSDGKKDLLVGQNFNDTLGSHGYVSFYENVGINSSPLFNNPDYLESCNTVCSYLDVAAGG